MSGNAGTGGSAGARGGTLLADRLAERLRWRMVLAALLLMLAATATLTLVTYHEFGRHLDRAMAAKSGELAWVLTEDFERASRHGVPLEELPGVGAYLETVRADHEEVLYLGLLAEGGHPLQATGSIEAVGRQRMAEAAESLLQSPADGALVSLQSEQLDLLLSPISDGSRTVAVIAVGTDRLYAERKVESMVFDVLTILLVSVFVAFEVTLALLVRGTATPIRQLLLLLDRAREGHLGTRLLYRSRDEVGRAAKRFNAVIEGLNERYASLSMSRAPTAAGWGDRLGLAAPGRLLSQPISSALDVRLPLFVFIFAEEMQKPFLPLYVRSLTPQADWITPEILIGLPISLYMAVLALATPWAGSLVDRLGVRRIFLAGLVPAVLGFLAAGLAPDLWWLLAGRAATALGYAAVTIAAQGYIAGVTPPNQRALGMSTFVGTLMAASICGTAVGGILAGEIGYRPVFGLAAGLGLLAGLLGWRMLSLLPEDAAGPVRPRLNFSTLGRLLANPRFLALLLFAAIPGKVVLTGFVIFGIPLYLAELDRTPAETARVILAYSLLVVFLGPWAARLADRSGRTVAFTFAGTLLSGLAVCLLDFWSGLAAATAAVGLLGLAHAVSISPQIALATQVCAREVEALGQTTVLGLLRMTERIGSVIGPILVGGLIAWQGFATAMLITGLAVVAAAFAFLALNRSRT